MKRLQSPTPNRKGVYEVHDVPSRKVALLTARGWKDVDAAEQGHEAAPDATRQPDDGARSMTATEAPQAHTSGAFDLSGAWMKTRAQVRDTLGMDRVPKNKAEAREMLEAAGYEVTEG